jgi:hypothetical protein
MPVCNRCEKEFDVETAPGALMFGHPSTVKEAVPVWKAHICQVCEAVMVSDWKRPPITALPPREATAGLIEACLCSYCAALSATHKPNCVECGIQPQWDSEACGACYKNTFCDVALHPEKYPQVVRGDE